MYGCGQCIPCRVNKKRIWYHRLLLEAAQHPFSAFVTLTYEYVQYTEDGLATLVPDHLKNFLKRLRRGYEPLRFRFFAVGEYGDETSRPHYHLILFGFPACERIAYRRAGVDCGCMPCSAVRQAWGLGHIQVDRAEADALQYTCGYVTKKLSKDHAKLCGRFPEFARMSNRPGIGAHFVDKITDALVTHDLEHSVEDVPSALRHGKKLLPLGRYLRRRLRKGIGRDEKAPQVVLDEQAAELQALRQIAWDRQVPLSEVIDEVVSGLATSIEARHRIFKKRSTL